MLPQLFRSILATSKSEAGSINTSSSTPFSCTFIMAHLIDKKVTLTVVRVSPASMSVLLRSLNPVEILASLA